MNRPFVLAILGVLFALPAASWGCTCSNATPAACQGLNVADAIFVGTVTSGETLPDSVDSQSGGTAIAHYRFHVEASYKSTNRSDIDIYSGGNDGDCGYRFKVGEKYLVLAYSSDDGRLFATICSGTRPAKDAIALLPQLEAMKRGEKVASVFGLLRRRDPPYEAISETSDDRPLGNIDIKLRSSLNRLETATDKRGIYTLYNIPAGEYHIAATVPRFLELADPSSKGPLPPLWLTSGACYEFNIDALPIGKIRGVVLGPDGKPVHPASVELYRQGRYKEDQPGWWEFQGSSGHFEFEHVPPGNYVLVFNRRDQRDPNVPYPRAFFPDAHDVEQAKLIKVGSGGQIVNADIHLSEGFASRRIAINLQWARTQPPHGIYVIARAEQGDNPIAQKLPDGRYEVTLLDGVRYKISAWGYIDLPKTVSRRSPPRKEKSQTEAAADPTPPVPQLPVTQPEDNSGCGPGGRIETPAVEVDGSNAGLKQVTLTFPKAVCGR